MELNLNDEEIKNLSCAVEYVLFHDWQAEDFLDVNLNTETLKALQKKLLILSQRKNVRWEQ